MLLHVLNDIVAWLLKSFVMSGPGQVAMPLEFENQDSPLPVPAQRYIFHEIQPAN